MLEVSPQQEQAVLEAYQQAGVPVRAVGSTTADPQVAISVDGQQQITGQSTSCSGLPASRPCEECWAVRIGLAVHSQQPTGQCVAEQHVQAQQRHPQMCRGASPPHQMPRRTAVMLQAAHPAAAGCVGSHRSSLLQPRLQRHWSSADASSLLQAGMVQLRTVWQATGFQSHHGISCLFRHACRRHCIAAAGYLRSHPSPLLQAACVATGRAPPSSCCCRRHHASAGSL